MQSQSIRCLWLLASITMAPIVHVQGAEIEAPTEDGIHAKIEQCVIDPLSVNDVLPYFRRAPRRSADLLAIKMLDPTLRNNWSGYTGLTYALVGLGNEGLRAVRMVHRYAESKYDAMEAHTSRLAGLLTNTITTTESRRNLEGELVDAEVIRTYSGVPEALDLTRGSREYLLQVLSAIELAEQELEASIRPPATFVSGLPPIEQGWDDDFTTNRLDAYTYVGTPQWKPGVLLLDGVAIAKTVATSDVVELKATLSFPQLNDVVRRSAVNLLLYTETQHAFEVCFRREMHDNRVEGTIALLFVDFNNKDNSELLFERDFSVGQAIIDGNWTVQFNAGLFTVISPQGKVEVHSLVCGEDTDPGLQKALLDNTTPQASQSHDVVSVGIQPDFAPVEVRNLHIAIRKSSTRRLDALQMADNAKAARDRGDLADTVRQYQNAKDILRDIYGLNHPLVLEMDVRLAETHRLSNNSAVAEQCLTDDLERLRNALPPSHLRLLSPLWSLSEVYKSENRYSDAAQLAAEGLRICRSVLKVENHISARFLHQLADVAAVQKDLAREEMLRLHAYEACARSLGDNHYATLAYATRMAEMLTDRKGDHEAAAKLYLDLLKRLPMTNLESRESRAMELEISLAIASAYGRLANSEAALPFAERALEILKSQGSSNEILRLRVQTTVGIYQARTGAIGAGLALVTATVEEADRIHGGDSWIAGVARRGLGVVLVESGETARGKQELDQSLKLVRGKTVGGIDRETARVLTELASAEEQLGDFVNAERHMDEVVAFRQTTLTATDPVRVRSETALQRIRMLVGAK